MRPSQVPQHLPSPPLHPSLFRFPLHEFPLPQGRGSPLTMSPSDLFFPASIGDTLVTVTQWAQDSPMALCQEKPLRLLCSPTTQSGHPAPSGTPPDASFVTP